MADHFTLGQLAEKFSVAPHVIGYALRRHGPEPSGRVGILRVWSERDLEAVAEALAKTAKRSTIAARHELALQ